MSCYVGLCAYFYLQNATRDQSHTHVSKKCGWKARINESYYQKFAYIYRQGYVYKAQT